MRGPAQLATYLGIGLVIVGFALIGLAWNGAAGFDTLQQQFPYLLSGGVAGIAFIIAGMALVVVQTQRELTAQRARTMQRLQSAMDRLAGTVGSTQRRDLPGTRTPVSVGAPAPAATRTVAPMPGDQIETAQFMRPEDQAVAATSDDLVVAGRSSFHDPACRLVASRDDLPEVSRRQATADGLSPCRVCKP
jgi:hypothetical protein